MADLAQRLRELGQPTVVVGAAPFDERLERRVVVAALTRVGKTEREPAHVRRGQRSDFRPGTAAVPEDGDHENAQPLGSVGQEARSAGKERVVVMRRHVEAVARREGLDVHGVHSLPPVTSVRGPAFGA